MDAGFSKSEAAKMIIMKGTPEREVSEQLAVPEGDLYKWQVKDLKELSGVTANEGGSPESMFQELTASRKELVKARRTNEILKKTVRFFSNPE